MYLKNQAFFNVIEANLGYCDIIIKNFLQKKKLILNLAKEPHNKLNNYVKTKTACDRLKHNYINCD